MKQVQRDHYSFSKVPPHRFQLYYWILRESLQLPSQVIAEIGIGAGIVSHVLSFNGKSVVKIDFDSSLCPDVSADIRKLPFKKESFDLVIASEVLEHIPFEHVPEAVAELNSITRRYLIVSVPYNQHRLELHLDLKINRYMYFRGWFNQMLRKMFPFRAYFGKDMSNKEFLFDGEHHWEIGYKAYPVGKIRRLFSPYFCIINELRVPLSPYHYLFVLEKKG